MDMDWLQKVKDYRAMRESSLRREYGWLSLAGLFWLNDGENPFGSDPENPVHLPERAPKKAGVFTLKDGQISITKAPDVSIRINENELGNSPTALKVDTSDEADYLFIGDIRFMVIERGGNLAVRVWDPESPVRRDFPGCLWFEPNAKYRVNAKIEPYPEPREFMFEDIIGIQRPMTIHATLVFQLNGNEYRLDAERLDDNSYDFYFRDLTANKTTYGAGRELTTDVAEGDWVIVDFNVARNLPCAYTEFATCPLPLPRNILPAEIEAGERYRG